MRSQLFRNRCLGVGYQLLNAIYAGSPFFSDFSMRFCFFRLNLKGVFPHNLKFYRPKCLYKLAMGTPVIPVYEKH